MRIAKDVFDVLEKKRQNKYKEDEFTIGDVDEDRFEFFLNTFHALLHPIIRIYKDYIK